MQENNYKNIEEYLSQTTQDIDNIVEEFFERDFPELTKLLNQLSNPPLTTDDSANTNITNDLSNNILLKTLEKINSNTNIRDIEQSDLFISFFNLLSNTKKNEILTKMNEISTPDKDKNSLPNFYKIIKNLKSVDIDFMPDNMETNKLAEFSMLCTDGSNLDNSNIKQDTEATLDDFTISTEHSKISDKNNSLCDYIFFKSDIRKSLEKNAVLNEADIEKIKGLCLSFNKTETDNSFANKEIKDIVLKKMEAAQSQDGLIAIASPIPGTNCKRLDTLCIGDPKGVTIILNVTINGKKEKWTLDPFTRQLKDSNDRPINPDTLKNIKIPGIQRTSTLELEKTNDNKNTKEPISNYVNSSNEEPEAKSNIQVNESTPRIEQPKMEATKIISENMSDEQYKKPKTMPNWSSEQKAAIAKITKQQNNTPTL